MSFGRTKPPSAAEARAKQKARIKRAGLRALQRAKTAAQKAGVDLSDWEGEFLNSVAERVTAYGRAFADPEKGGAGSALSVGQARKLKEISVKAKGEQALRLQRARSRGAAD